MNALVSRRTERLKQAQTRFSISTADGGVREEIYRIRYEIYARELGQHLENEAGRLRDELDSSNVYRAARVERELAGFISITPPYARRYSIDKYFTRESLPFTVDGALHEVRLLTVLPEHRGGEVALLLTYGAFRWIEAHGGERIVDFRPALWRIPAYPGARARLHGGPAGIGA